MAKLIESYEFRLIEPGCAPGSGRYGVLVSLLNDISPVFPYLNALETKAWYDHQNRILILRELTQAYAMRPTEIRIARVDDPTKAQQIAREIVDRINNVWEDRHNIEPRLTERKRLSVIDIFKLLPRTNCKRCGYVTCLAYASDLSQGMVQVEQCLPLSQPEQTENRERLLSLVTLD